MASQPAVLAVIPARGGSKGVPRKNIRPFCGKPLIAWTIEEAKKTRHPIRIVVSTDDPEIAQVAKQYTAEAPFLRPAGISGDLATDVEFLLHALNFFQARESYQPEIILRLPPTSPLRTADDIDRGIAMLLDTPDADAVRPIIESPKHPYKSWQLSADGKWLKPFLSKEITGVDEPHNMPRQVFPKAYIHTGAMDVVRLRTIREMRSTQGRNLAYFFMDPQNSINIDHQLDFEFAEYLMKKRQGVLL
jgi:CMP-N-acetylneuraminic acid synthetase